MLATISAQERWISLWDVNGATAVAANADSAAEDTGLETARRTATIMAPYRRRFTQQPLACMSFEPSRAGENNPNRVLTVTMSGLVEDLCLTESLAVAISPAGGVTFAAGRDVYWCDAPHVNSFYCVPDTGTRMRVRLGLGYSLDINENRKLFSKACDVVKRSMARQWDSTQVHLPAALPASRTPQSKPTFDLYFDEDVYGGLDELLIGGRGEVHHGGRPLRSESLTSAPETRVSPTADGVAWDAVTLEQYQQATDLRHLRGMWEWLALTRGPSSAVAAAAGGAGVCAMLDSRRHLHVLADRLAMGLPVDDLTTPNGGEGADPTGALRLPVPGVDGAASSATGDDPVEQSVARPCGPFTAYYAQRRTAALRLCGWAADDAAAVAGTPGAGAASANADPATATSPSASPLDELISRCERTGRGDRAVAMAVWHGQLRKAVKSLERGAARRREFASHVTRGTEDADHLMAETTPAHSDAAMKVRQPRRCCGPLRWCFA